MVPNRASKSRFILKVSGEALLGEAREQNVDVRKFAYLRTEIEHLMEVPVELGIVMGAGNFFRGSSLSTCREISRVTGDYVGMVSTILNGLLLREFFAYSGFKVKLVSAIEVESLVERYNVYRADEYLSAGYIVIFVAGTGNPLFTSDTALFTRGVELRAAMVLKATHKVDGVYDMDPLINPQAKPFSRLSYDTAIRLGLNILDRNAFLLGEMYKLKLGVYNFNRAGALGRMVRGEPEGTIID